MLGDRREMLGPVAAGEQGAVDGRVQRLQPAIEQLGEAGDLVHGDDVDSGGTKRGRRAAGGDDLPPELSETLGKGDDPALVTD